jgi:hypothetical protein
VLLNVTGCSGSLLGHGSLCRRRDWANRSIGPRPGLSEQGPEPPLSSLVNRSPTGNSGNAMILPFPAIPGTMGQANVLETKRCRDILQDIAGSVSPTLRSLRLPPKNASRAKKACASAIANRSPRPSRPTSGARSSAGDMPRKCPTVTSCANWRMCTEATLSRRERGRPAHQRRLAAEPSRDEMKPQKSSRGPVVPN